MSSIFTWRRVLTAVLVLFLALAAFVLNFAYNFGAFKRVADYKVDHAQAELEFKQAEPLENLLALADDESGFESFFSDNTLTGWTGNPEFWSIKDQIVTGDSKGFLTYNTFLYSDAEYADFVLKFTFKLEGESPNSGVQYRSELVNPERYQIGGYQADIAFDEFGGCLIEEDQRWMLAWAGERVWIDQDGGRAKLSPVGDETELLAKFKKDEWNTYTVIAKGNRLIHRVNGAVFLDVIDDDTRAKRSGKIAFQLHSGGRQFAHFKHVKVKSL